MRELAYFGAHKHMKRLFPESVDDGMGDFVALVHPNDDNAFSVYAGEENAVRQHAENLAVRVGGYVVDVKKNTALPEPEQADAVPQDHNDTVPGGDGDDTAPGGDGDTAPGGDA